MKKTFKSSSFCNNSNFHNDFVWNPPKVQRLRQKVNINENVSFIYIKFILYFIFNLPTLRHYYDIFDVVLFLLPFLVSGPSFNINIITSSGVMTIFFYKGLTRNPEIGNTFVWVFANIWRLRWVRDAKFGTNVSNKMLLNAAKCQGYSFYRFWVNKGKPTAGGGR